MTIYLTIILFLYFVMFLFFLHLMLIIITQLTGLLFQDVHFVPTDKKVWPFLLEELEIVDHDVIYDLGCGDAKFLIDTAKKYPNTKFVGVELNWIQVFQARFYKWLAGSPKNLRIIQGNFYKIDFNDATKVFVYLLPKIMKKIFFREKERITKIKVVSRAFKIEGLEPDKTVTVDFETPKWGRNKIYIYYKI